MKTTLFTTLTLFVALILSGCLASNEYYIVTTIDSAEIDGNTLYVNGTSNLPDGAIVEISAQPGQTDPADNNFEFNPVTAEVADGKWSSTHHAEGYTGDTVTIEFSLSNMLDNQPDNVTNALGDKGQKIGNDDVFIGDGVYAGTYTYDYTEERTVQE